MGQPVKECVNRSSKSFPEMLLIKLKNFVNEHGFLNLTVYLGCSHGYALYIANVKNKNTYHLVCKYLGIKDACSK